MRPRRAGVLSTGFDDEFDGGADFILDLDIHEFGDADDVDAIVFEVAGGEDEGFDGLVDGAGADGLHFCAFVFADDARDGPGDG